LEAVELCDPERLWVQHGYCAVAARYLRSIGRDAQAIDRTGRRDEDAEEETTAADNQRGGETNS
jgi:putative mRNA 3-end processing factor